MAASMHLSWSGQDLPGGLVGGGWLGVLLGAFVGFCFGLAGATFICGSTWAMITVSRWARGKPSRVTFLKIINSCTLMVQLTLLVFTFCGFIPLNLIVLLGLAVLLAVSSNRA